MGLSEEQINQPLVGVATTWNEAAPCNIALSRQAQAEQQWREGGGHRGQSVIQHRHLDEEAARPLGAGSGELERHVGAERGPADDRGRLLEVVELYAG